MADRGDAKFFQIVSRQLRQDAQVDLVLAESPLVSLQAEPLQPAPDVHRVVPAPIFVRIVTRERQRVGACDAPGSRSRSNVAKTHHRPSLASLRMTAKGHEDQFPPPRLSGGCVMRKRSFAGGYPGHP